MLRYKFIVTKFNANHEAAHALGDSEPHVARIRACVLKQVFKMIEKIFQVQWLGEHGDCT